MSTFQMPFYFIKTVSQAEKDAWIKQAQDEAKKYDYQGNRISAEFEPIKGWRPFAKYGTNPVEIIHNCIQDYDNTVNKILFRKDRLPYKKDAFHLTGQIVAFDFYHNYNPHNALAIQRVIGRETSVYNIMNKPTNYPESDLAYSYQDYYNKFPPEVKQYILNMNLPYVKADGGLDGMQAHVFPPAICETSSYDLPYNSTITSAFEDIKWTIVRWEREKKADSFWLRESCTGMSQFVWQRNIGLTRNRIDSEQLLFPCFCIG